MPYHCQLLLHQIPKKSHNTLRGFYLIPV